MEHQVGKYDRAAPRPWTVDETPNGVYIRGSDGIRFGCIIGNVEKARATAKLIAETLNAGWLKVVQHENLPEDPVDDGDGPPVAAA
jgi:hypothetical protein